jgi:2-hydroxychromene-2-carboxylate isomerase
MGELIPLDQRRDDRSRSPRDSRPAFFFDLSCPFSYLAAERVERELGEVEWVPVASATVCRGRGDSDVDAIKTLAERRAIALRLRLVWPEQFPFKAPRALRAAARAVELGAGPRFALAAGRLAFCGGFDLEDPETLAEAAAAAGVPWEECLVAARDADRDAALQLTADELRSRGMRRLPAFRVGRRWLQGEREFDTACALRHAPAMFACSMAPHG